MCQVCKPKQIGKVISSSNPQIPALASFAPTGKTKQMISPLTGQLTTYVEGFCVHVTQPAPSGLSQADLDGIRDQVTTQANASGYDAICDTVLVVQGTLQDTYKTRTWFAETSTPSGRLIFGVDDLVIIGVILIIAVVIAAVVIVVILDNSFMAIANKLLPSQPGYVGGTASNPQSFTDFASYLSYQHTLFCLVCPKCGAGWALKTNYPECLNIPQEIIDQYNEHVKNCLGIPQTNYSATPFFVWAIIGVGGALVGFYIVYKIIASRRSSRD